MPYVVPTRLLHHLADVEMPRTSLRAGAGRRRLNERANPPTPPILAGVGRSVLDGLTEPSRRRRDRFVDRKQWSCGYWLPVEVESAIAAVGLQRSSPTPLARADTNLTTITEQMAPLRVTG